MFRPLPCWTACALLSLSASFATALRAETGPYHISDAEPALQPIAMQVPPDPFVDEIDGSMIDERDEPAIDGFDKVIEPEVYCDTCPPRSWVRGEYLLWWTKGNDLPALVTTGTENGRGRLGDDGTEVLFGQQQIDNQYRNGFRLTAGRWLDDCQELGFEANYFSVFDDTGTGDFFAQTGSTDAGSPIIARPFTNAAFTSLPEDSVLVSYPSAPTPLLGSNGSIRISSSSEMHSASALLRRRFRQGCNGRVDLIGGYRYFRYREGLHLEMDLVSTATGSNIVPGTTFDDADHFATANDFHGGEFGMTAEFWRNCWTVNLLAKVALGNLHRQVTIDGSETRTVPGAGSATSSGAMLALPTNIGQRADNDFAALPEFGLNVTYQATDHVSFVFGYTLLMLNDVARTGEQIDRVLNSTQFSGGTLSGPARPMSLFANEDDFWAQGINVGFVWEG